MIRLVLSFQHALNPLHCYCRLVDWGISKKWAMFICSWYERLVYSWLCPITIFLVSVTREIKTVIIHFRTATHLPRLHH